MQVPKQINSKIFFATVILAIILLVSTITLVLGPSANETFTISGGVYPGAPNYTIWSNSTHFFAKTNFGILNFTSTNQTYVLTQVLALNPRKVECYGNFNLGTYTIREDNLDISFFEGDLTANLTLAGGWMRFEAQRLNGKLIDGGLQYSEVEIIEINPAVGGTAFEIDLDNVEQQVIQNRYEIFLIHEGAYGLRIYGSGNIFQGNYVFISFFDNQTTTCVSLETEDGVGAFNEYFFTLEGEGFTPEPLLYCAEDYNVFTIPFYGGQDGSTPLNITGGYNILNLPTDAGITANQTNLLLINGRVIQENYVRIGTGTITASTTVTFDHGLPDTPDHVEIGWMDTGWTSWKWSATSTQITVTVETSGTYDFSWRAVYKP